MQSWEFDNAVAQVAAQIRKAKERGLRAQVPLLARKAINAKGVTHKPDVARLAKRICAELGARKPVSQKDMRGAIASAKALAERISP